MAATQSFLSPEFFADPYPQLGSLRERAPVVFLEPMGFYVAVGYDAARKILLDPKRFSSVLRVPGSLSEEATRIISEEGYGRNRPALANNDAPSHTAFRGLVNEAFRPKRIRQMADYVDGIVAELIDALVEAGGVADLVRDFAVPLPLIVIADQLGVPRSLYRTFKEWSDAWLGGLGANLTEEQDIANAHKVVAMQRYLAERVNERREEGQDDILSDLAQAEVDGERLDMPTVLAIVEQLLVAGNETTTNGIASGLYALTQLPDCHGRLRAQPEQAGEFAEEVLRIQSPVQGLFRRAVADVTVEGVEIPQGGVVLVHYGAANRDGAKFDRADRFDLERPKKGQHIAFGSGIHHCVGSELARVEMRASFRAFTARFTALELADPNIHYHPTFVLRGIESLKVRLQA